MENPKIVIVLPAYNAEKTLKKTLKNEIPKNHPALRGIA